MVPKSCLAHGLLLLHIYAFGPHNKYYEARVCWITKLLLYLEDIQTNRLI